MANLKVLCVGLCCVDIINEVASYPKEDTDQRCISQKKQRGGNASNNATVFGLLGWNPHYFGVLADSFDLAFLKQDFINYGVNVDLVVVQEGFESPNSYIITSADTGSRTIIHCNNNIAEVTLEQFEAIDLSQFSWIHFEGRNIQEVTKIIQHIRKVRSDNNHQITVSIELEQPRENLEYLIPLADVLFLSKDFAISNGWHSMEDAVCKIYEEFKPSGITICAWGEVGAAAKICSDSPVCVSKSFPPHKIVDTLGAGDTLVSGTIHSLNKDRSLNEAIEFGCRIAGAKIGHKGWSYDLKEAFKNVYTS